MFFTRIARVIAFGAIVLGVLKCAMAFWVINSFAEQDTAWATSRYIGSGTTGDSIDEGIMVILFGVCLGVATEIARAVCNPTSK